jgi:hypothetical protein
MKLNKNLKRVLVTLALIAVGFTAGKQQGEQEILNRWENRWFDSEWYDYKSIEEILYDSTLDNYMWTNND